MKAHEITSKSTEELVVVAVAATISTQSATLHVH